MQVCDLSLERFVLIAACACEGTRSQNVDKLSWVLQLSAGRKHLYSVVIYPNPIGGSRKSSKASVCGSRARVT